jgi:hypothetical protein
MLLPYKIAKKEKVGEKDRYIVECSCCAKLYEG